MPNSGLWKVLEQGEKVQENFKQEGEMADRKKILNEWFLSDVNKELEANASTKNQRIGGKIEGKRKC